MFLQSDMNCPPLILLAGAINVRPAQFLSLIYFFQVSKYYQLKLLLLPSPRAFIFQLHNNPISKSHDNLHATGSCIIIMQENGQREYTHTHTQRETWTGKTSRITNEHAAVR